MKMWKRNCPKCGEKVYYSRIYERDRAEKRNTNCKSCSKKGKKRKPFTDKWKKNLSESMMGDKNPAKRPEVRKKMSESKKGCVPWNKGKTNVYSEEILENWRLSALKRIEKNNGQVIPNHNPVGCDIIRWFNMYYDFNFQHAENGGEVCIGGYFPDGVDEKKKTIIEIDEPRHFNGDGTLKEKDIRRQKYLESLGYTFIRVRI